MIPFSIENMKKIFVTYYPPKGKLDNGTGKNYTITNMNNIIIPDLHLFGHVKKQRGIILHDKTVYSNGYYHNY